MIVFVQSNHGMVVSNELQKLKNKIKQQKVFYFNVFSSSLTFKGQNEYFLCLLSDI